MARFEFKGDDLVARMDNHDCSMEKIMEDVVDIHVDGSSEIVMVTIYPKDRWIEHIYVTEEGVERALRKMLPQLREALEKNQQRADYQEHKAACAQEAAEQKIKKDRSHALSKAWEEKNVAELNQLLNLKAGSFKEISKMLKSRGTSTTVHQGKSGYDRNGDYDCYQWSEITTRFQDESGWSLTWRDEKVRD